MEPPPLSYRAGYNAGASLRNSHEVLVIDGHILSPQAGCPLTKNGGGVGAGREIQDDARNIQYNMHVPKKSCLVYACGMTGFERRGVRGSEGGGEGCTQLLVALVG